MGKGLSQMLVHSEVDSLINGIVSILKDNVEEIILFGSVARSEATEDSDIDVAIITSNKIDINTKNVLSEHIFNINLNNNVLITTSYIQKDNFDKWKGIYPFYINIINEGMILWRKAKLTA